MIKRLPSWARASIPGGDQFALVKKTIAKTDLHTVCVEARCPNMGECFGAGTATFLILGDTCTRHCAYCAVKKGIPLPPEYSEPERVALAVAELHLAYAVITSVTRDDLEDGGAAHFSAVISAIRNTSPACGIEVLVPDFQNSMEPSIDLIARTHPDVLNHNIEVARPIFPALRPEGNYGASLRLMEYAASRQLSVKSGFMVGLGETMDAVAATLHDLRDAGCSHVTVGQYLRSRKDNHPVVKFYSPDEFETIAAMAKDTGMEKIQCGPLVRSSYHAGIDGHADA